jgi:putative tricarboxylic transport membrane protein
VTDVESPRRQSIVVGGVLVVLAAVSLVEARRLYHLRTNFVAGAVVGDDTFPMVVGVAFAMLGAYMLAWARLPAVEVALPRAPVGGRMLAGAGLLVAYAVLVPVLGYTAATALVSVALFARMGGYRWPVALVLGAVTTGALYLVFRVWLLQPLPAGLLGA